MISNRSFVFEPGSEESFDEMADLYNAVDFADHPDFAKISGDFFRSSYAVANIIPSRDVLHVRKKGGGIIASATSYMEDPEHCQQRIVLQVHPNFRGQGLGSMLLDRVLHRSRNAGARTVKCRVQSYRPESVYFAEKNGFVLDHSYVKMRLSLKSTIPTSQKREDVRIRHLDIDTELGLWAQLQNAIFEDTSDYAPVTVEKLKTLVQKPQFDSSLALIIEEGGKSIGICTGWTFASKEDAEDKVLQIQGFGVLKQHRGNGFGGVLLREMLNRGRDLGYTSAELLVLNSAWAARHLYSKVGFKERYRHLIYVRNLIGQNASTGNVNHSTDTHETSEVAKHTSYWMG